jgi:hypothetical protein
MKALIGAILLNALLFGWIICVWFFSSHFSAEQKNQPEAMSALSGFLVSSSALDSKVSKMDAIVSQAFHHEAVIQKTFVAPGHLDGLVLALKDSPNEQFIAYYDPAHELLYLGQVIDATGKNTTLAATQTYLSNPEKPMIIDAFNAMPAVVTGAKQPSHTITILVDPNSPWFRALYQNFYLDQRAYGLQVRWILVDYLKPMGPNLAGWILSSKDPAQRLQQVAHAPLEHWTNLTVPPLSLAVVHALRTHWNAMQSYHLVPGPITLFKTKDQDYVIEGLVDPESFEQLLPDILR